MLTLLLSNHCILSLVLNVMNQVEDTVVCMAKLLSSNAHTSSNFNTSCKKLWCCLVFNLFFLLLFLLVCCKQGLVAEAEIVLSLVIFFGLIY